MRGERLDPLTIGPLGVLQESAHAPNITAHTSYNRKMRQLEKPTTLCKNNRTDLLSIAVPGIVRDLRNVVHECCTCAIAPSAATAAAVAIDAVITHNDVRRFGSRSSPSNGGPKESIHEGWEDEHGANECVKRDGML